MKITKTSTFTGKEHTMDLPITQAEIDRWHGGELIQNVWPELKPHEREFMITGTTQEEWDKAFPEEEDDDNDQETFTCSEWAVLNVEFDTQVKLDQLSSDLANDIKNGHYSETCLEVKAIRTFIAEKQIELNKTSN